MSNDQPKPIKFILPPASFSRSGGSGGLNTRLTLPGVLGGGHARSAADPASDLFINERALQVESVFDLSGVGRSASKSGESETLVSNQLVTLEATDGTTLIMRVDKLQEELARLYPGEGLDDKNQVNIRVLKDQEAVARGLGDWIWSRMSVLKLSPDGIVETAKDKALELLKDKLGEHVEGLVSANASYVGAKALMWAIESKLVGEPGLYRWHEKDLHAEDKVGVEDPGLVKAAENGEPILVFIHGTASSTTGSYSALHEGTVDEGGWEKLTRGFAGRVYGFEHYTFSDSPLDNALQLARTLPKGSRISLITHSRGGLVGDLFCSGEYKDDLISRYQRAPVLEERGEFKGKERPENKKLREKIVAEEKEQLRQLRAILKDKQFKIERYVRVAAPASGTTILSENLDLFLSGLLSLVNAAVSLIPAVGTMGSTALAAFRRIVLEIAEKRIDPRLIPGIEAMLPDSPLTAFLAQAPRADGIDMAVVAGSVDGDSGNFFKRIAIMLTDWIIFNQFENDFVVDTQSMRAGLARRNQTREFFAHGHQVSHIRYFDRHDSRRAVCKWITDEKPQLLPMFHPIPTDAEVKLDQFGTTGSDLVRGESVRAKDAPLVVYLPGIMGSHLEIIQSGLSAGEGDRVWFDPFHLTMGGIAQLSIDKGRVRPEGIFRRYYGELEAYLEHEHEVVTFAYDWRKPIQETADKLAAKIEEQLEAIKDQPQRQLSILAHSMGGLVVRTMIAQHPELWDRIVDRAGGNFVMLGTPNHGSHQTVENLMGKGASIRQLAMLDFQHSLQEIIDIVADFPGMLQLLPPGKFVDTGVTDLAADGKQEALDYHYLNQKGWGTLRAQNRDRWFSNELGPRPDSKTMQLARDLWDTLLKQDETFPHAERVAYVFGLDGHTPCGVVHDKDEKCLHLMGTAQGDGSVSWKSGRLASLTQDRYWYMPVPHAGLTNTSEYFPALVELLRKGRTEKLERKAPRTRSASARSYRYDAGPTLQPGAEDLVLSFFGGRPMRDTAVDETQLLEVKVRAMDLRFTQHPVMCGHYLDDSIAGAEKLIDSYLVKGALTQRERLGIYAGELGTNTIVLNPRTTEERARGSGRGAIIVGLGKWEKVTLQALTNAVRDAALQFLLHTAETVVTSDGVVAEEEALTINSLLIGHNSTTHITVDASIDAIVLAVCEANQQYRHNRSKQQPARAIRKLEFIEYYMDTAISAAYAVRGLPVRLEKDFLRLNARIVPATELHYSRNDGARDRLSNHGQSNGYWSRLMVVDAEEEDSQCPPECYEKWLQPSMPKKVRDALEKQLGVEQSHKKGLVIAESAGVAERLKYVYLSERARAETQVQQRQPGLIEALIKESIRDSSYDADICRTLFQLMMPLDFKPAARQTQQLLLVLDGYTANLPWEMLQADDEPLALKIAMVRQLVSSRYRKSVTSSLNKTACVIGNPSTAEFHNYFDLGLDLRSGDPTHLPSLQGATNEAKQVSKTLRDSGYEVETLFPKQVDAEATHSAIQVFNTLFKKPYRILMIAAHGEVGVVSRRDGKRRTGVVLSDGVMLTAAEVGQMEVVPDLVFLNCCHLAKLDNTAHHGGGDSYNRLAYSISRELIEMGVRCVIAAGWAVDDNAATTFSTHFFERFTSGQPFGKAVWEARRKTNEMHHNLNTWGAYQAYGDPNYVLNTEKTEGINTESWSPVARQELTSELKRFQVNIKRSAMSEGYNFGQLTADVEGLLQRVPPEWVSRPGVQYQLAELYGAMLPEGFRHAESACLQAILHEDKDGHVPIRALELLGNLEAKQAEKLSEQAAENYIASKQVDLEENKRDALLAEREHLLERAEELIETAIKRLQGLLKITHEMHEQVGNESGIQCEVNAERFAMLASAYKRQAMVMIRQDGKKWLDILKVLTECRDNYAKGENVIRDDRFNPYLTINRLQLDGLFGETSEQRVELAKKAQAVARQQFLGELQFYDGVMAADAVVAIYLLDDEGFNELLGSEGKMPSEKDFLVSAFTDSVANLSYSVSEFKSVTQQLECLSVFLRKRAEHDASEGVEQQQVKRLKQKFKVLSEVAAALNKL